MSDTTAAIATLTVEEFLAHLPTRLAFASAGGQPFSVVVSTYRTIAGFPTKDWCDRVRPNLHGDTLTMRIGGYAGMELEFSVLDPAVQDAVFKSVYAIVLNNPTRPMLVVAYGGNDHLHRIWTHLCREIPVFTLALVVCSCATARMALGDTAWPWVGDNAPAWLIEGACHGDHALGQIVQALSLHFQIPLSV